MSARVRRHTINQDTGAAEVVVRPPRLHSILKEWAAVGAGWGEIDAQDHKNRDGFCEIVQHGLSPPDGAIVRCGST
jgi:hypothetical protein